MLNISNGGTVSDGLAYLGYGNGSSGTATVDGAGSKWTNTSRSSLYVGNSGSGAALDRRWRQRQQLVRLSRVRQWFVGHGNSGWHGSIWTSSYLWVGNSGSGTLNISNGGAVSVAYSTTVSDSSASINFGPNGGTLSTGWLIASPARLTGAGTINTKGLVSGFDLMFDGSAKCSTTFGTGGMLTVNMSAAGGGGYLGVGYGASSTLDVRNGAVVYSYSGYLGYNSGSSGTATVDGPGSNWVNFFSLYVGNSGTGTLNVINGGTATSTASYSYLGYASGSTGTVTVDGVGSNWNAGFLYIGNSGSGTLNITQCGSVDCGSSEAYLGYNSGSSGTVTVDGSGSKWVCNRVCIGYSGSGTLNIINGASVSWTSASGGFGSLGDQSGSTGKVTVDGAGSTWISGPLYIGGGAGTLTISNGGSVSSSDMILGSGSGSTGTAVVDGPGSNWTISGSSMLLVGVSGSGTLKITHGGNVDSSSDDDFIIGYASGSTGTVTVDGVGSKWTSGSWLCVGYDGQGTLEIANGGTVSAGKLTIDSQSLLAIDVGRNSLFTAGGGTGFVSNGGTIRILAGAGVPTDGVQYSPISAGSWGGTGTYQAVGGTWNTTNQTFTASSVTHGTSGTPVSLDLVIRPADVDRRQRDRLGGRCELPGKADLHAVELHRHSNEQWHAERPTGASGSRPIGSERLELLSRRWLYAGRSSLSLVQGWPRLFDG